MHRKSINKEKKKKAQESKKTSGYAGTTAIKVPISKPASKGLAVSLITSDARRNLQDEIKNESKVNSEIIPTIEGATIPRRGMRKRFPRMVSKPANTIPTRYSLRVP